MTIKLDKNIPIPRIPGRYKSYPFGDMNVGDSFKIAQADETAAIRQAACQYARRHDKKMKFSILKFEDGYRCWRVA